MNRRALLTSLGSTLSLPFAGCTSSTSNPTTTDSRTTTARTKLATEATVTSADADSSVERVDAGDTVSLPAGEVELGSLSVQSSFHSQLNLAWNIVGEREELVVVLDLDVSAYDERTQRLPISIEVDGETNPAGSDFPVHTLNRPDVSVGLPVPTGKSAASAVVLTGNDTTYRYVLPDALQKQIREPPVWDVEVSFPEQVRSDGEFDVAITATNTGAGVGTLVGGVTHDRIYDMFWKFTVAAAAGETVTETVTVDYVGGEAGDLGVSASWGLGSTSATVTVVTDG